MTKKIWDEAAIRAELRKLDAMTGLTGAKLPISFGNAKRTLGQYNSADGGSFRFSNHFFQDPDWPVEEALDVIRHEYAHYMDHKTYGNVGHGTSWKICCGKIGATPSRCYSEKRAQYYREKHAEEAELSAHYDSYCAGSKIIHPRYGIGVVKEVSGESLVRYIWVDFASVGSKMLSLPWVDKNCKRSP